MVDDFKENYQTGFISLFRSIKNHWIFQNDQYFKWWILILLEANFKDNKIVLGYDIHEVKRGQCANSLRTWSNLFACSTKTVSKFFNLLKKDGMIFTETIGKGKHSTTLVNINNYNDYQLSMETQQGEKEKRNGNATETQEPFSGDTTNNDNNDNNDNNVNKRGKSKFSPPSLDDIKKQILDKKYLTVRAESFYNFYESKNWYVGKNKMADWKKALGGWESRNNDKNGKSNNSSGVNGSSQGYKPARVDTSKLVQELTDDLENGNVPGQY